MLYTNRFKERLSLMQALMLDYQRIRFHRKGAEVKMGACLTHLGEVQSEEQVQLHF